MKACRAIPKTKNLTETGGFDILHRLRQRYNNMDEMSKAAYLLHYHSLKQLEGESGAEFVDQEQREYHALQQMGVNIDVSLRLTKSFSKKQLTRNTDLWLRLSFQRLT